MIRHELMTPLHGVIGLCDLLLQAFQAGQKLHHPPGDRRANLAVTHGGLGFSAVAEPYMNFGPWGVAAAFLLLAYALVWADRLETPGPLPLAA